MIIDFHTHVFPPWVRDNREENARRDPCFSHLYSNPKATIITAEELIDGMDENEVDISVICNIGWGTQEICNETNDYILESVARYPDRLVGFCAIQPNAGDAAIREIERCAKGGALGLGELRPDDQGFDLTNKELMSPIAEVMEKYHMLFNTHTSEPVGHIYPGKGKVTPDTLYPFICNFPELRIILAHWGGGLPFYALMPEVAKAMTNTYFDVAATPFLYNPQIFRHVAEIAGADKILMGSDYPLMPAQRVVKQIKSVELSPEVEAMILGGNAQRLIEWSRSAAL